MNKVKTVSISELNASVSRFLRANIDLSKYHIKGELSNVKYYSNGTIYFSLKDAEAQISCVMWGNLAKLLDFEAKNGVEVLVKAQVRFYEKGGNLQLEVQQMQASGFQGEIYQKYLEDKERFEKLGYFSPERKKPFPFLPKKVGVVTSAEGAVIRDIIKVATKRFHKPNILLYPAAVQGESAVPELIAGLKYLDAREDVEVIILARGGGSREDLWCFNHPDLVETLYRCKTPVVSAVGHQSDHSLSDEVADHSSPTPSAAAEFVFPEYQVLESRIDEQNSRLKQALNNKLYQMKQYLLTYETMQAKALESFKYRQKESLNRYKEKLAPYEPYTAIQNYKNKIAQFEQKTHFIIQRRLEQSYQKKEQFAEKLDALSPLKVLKRGYSRTLYEGKTLDSVSDLKKGADIEVELYDGILSCQIKDIIKK